MGTSFQPAHAGQANSDVTYSCSRPFQRRKQVRFLGVWDTVKSVGWLNLKARIELARWPFTANLANVHIARHALALDERRRTFAEYRFKKEAVAAAGDRFQEMWFPGVHGDIGGQSREGNRLPDLAFSWMSREASAAGLHIDKHKYATLLGVPFDAELPHERALGVIRPNASLWWLAGGWRIRKVRPDDLIHPSAHYRVEASRKSDTPYKPRNLPSVH